MCVKKKKKKRKCNLQRGREGRKEKGGENKRKKEGSGYWSLPSPLQARDPRCVTTEKALNNSHDIDLVTLLPTSLPQPGRESPPVGLPLSPQRCSAYISFGDTHTHTKTHIMKKRDKDSAISLMTSDK